jgi:superfamily II DNA helicase RecQ
MRRLRRPVTSAMALPAIRRRSPLRGTRSRKRADRQTQSGQGATQPRKPVPAKQVASLGTDLGVALKAWRKGRSAVEKVPAFRIMSDAVMSSIIAAEPRSLEALRSCKGMGAVTVGKYGEEILRIVRTAV